MKGENMNRDLLFANQRIHPKFYYVKIRGEWERTVSIRAGISWPQADSPGYFVTVAQLEKKHPDHGWRYLAFEEYQVVLMSEFFKKISHACAKNRIDNLCHGDEQGEQSYSGQLWDYLKKKKAGDGREIVQRPNIGKSWRCKDMDFISQLVRAYIANKTLLLVQSSEGRTPLLIDKTRNAGMDTDLLKIPEIRALGYVMDDFNSGPWSPPKKRKPFNGSNWAL
jgi:hypothetical protein